MPFLSTKLLDLIAQGHKGGELCLPAFSIASEYSWELFGIGVWSDTETTTIVELIKETQHFYMETTSGPIEE